MPPTDAPHPTPADHGHAPASAHRRILVVAAAILAFAGFGVYRGLQPEYPCSPGWHKAPVPITAHVGVCLDRDNNCLPVPRTDQDGQQTFSMGSCVPVTSRNADSHQVSARLIPDNAKRPRPPH